MPGADRNDLLEDLVDRHHAELYAYAVRLTARAADAEDLTQQVFLQASQHLDQLRDPGSARAWLFTILRNCWQASHRRDARSPVSDPEADLAQLAAAPVDPEIDVEGLQLALAELSEEHRVVLVMFYFEDCSYREIATRLGLPEGTVMSRLSRAKRHLRKRLLPEPTDETDPRDPSLTRTSPDS